MTTPGDWVCGGCGVPCFTESGALAHTCGEIPVDPTMMPPPPPPPPPLDTVQLLELLDRGVRALESVAMMMTVVVEVTERLSYPALWVESEEAP